MKKFVGYKEGALNAAKISSKDFIAHMASFGLDSYGEPLSVGDGRGGAEAGGDDKGAAAEAAAAAAELEADSQQTMATQKVSLLFSQEGGDLPGLALFDPDALDRTPAFSAGQGDIQGAVGSGDDGGGDGGQRQVSAPHANDDHDRVGIVDDPAPTLVGARETYEHLLRLIRSYKLGVLWADLVLERISHRVRQGPRCRTQLI